MKRSIEGAPLGRGIQQVKRRIEKAFEDSRRTPTDQNCATRLQTQLTVRIQRDAVKHTVQHTRHQETHVIAVPREAVAELFALCKRAINKLNIPQEKSHRYEVEGE